MKYLTIIFFLFFSLSVHSQILLENKNGISQFIPLLFTNSNSTDIGLLKLNTGEQSIGIDYYNHFNKDNTSPQYLNFGISVKPTQGVGAIFNTGEFLPGFDTKISYTIVKLFDSEDTKPENHFLDWLSIGLSYSINKYQLFNKDYNFNEQVYTKVFQGYGVNVNYNMLLCSKFLISSKIGYERSNNTNFLKNVEIIDKLVSHDSISSTTREVSKKITGKNGIFKEYNNYPVEISITKLTEDNKDAIQIGYSLYYNFAPNTLMKTISNTGLFIYFAKPVKTISTSVIAVNLELQDLSDTQEEGNSLFKRLFIGLTTNINIF